jgi:hypothetical protein
MGEIPDEGNLEEILKQDKFMKEIYKNELGDDFESFENGVAIGKMRHPPLVSFENGIWPETDDRMNIIGQNGNDGLHYDKGEEDV